MKYFLTYGIVVASCFAALLNPSQLESANLTTVTDTLQTSRLSFNGRVDSTGTTAGSSNVKILTSAVAPANSISTAGLKVGDTLTIGSSTDGYYTIVGITDADEFSVSPVLNTGDADNTDPIYFKAKPRHVVKFTTASAVANGSFRILLPADATTPNDGAPDDQGFDFNTTVDVTAANVTGYTFAAGTSTAYGGVNCTAPANYHCFDIGYTGTGAVASVITINIGNTNGTNSLIAPAPATTTEAVAETYTYIVRNYASGADPDAVPPIDATSGKLALIEGVRVTATVDPTISFSIAGVSTATTVCGATPDIDTTTGVNAPLAVPFGTMALNTFKDAAHNLTVSTNAASGYAVTATENDQLSRGGLGVTVIPDTDCDGEDCTITAATEWNTGTDNGFGYSLENAAVSPATSIAFQYSDTANFAAKPFAVQGTDTPEPLFSSTTVADAQNIYVCYRLGVGATQAAGDYENQITYTATGIF
jgi:hypothetical protein